MIVRELMDLLKDMDQDSEVKITDDSPEDININLNGEIVSSNYDISDVHNLTLSVKGVDVFKTIIEIR